MAGQRIGYVRVSTLDQNGQRQLDGLVLDRVFTDRASGRDTDRPELTELLRFARDGDTVWCTAWTGSRGTSMTCAPWFNVSPARACGWSSSRSTCSYWRGLPHGEPHALRHGAFAEFERALIRERQREGIALAKQRGAYKGRKKILTPERAAELAQRAAGGVPKSVLARDYGISRETVYQYLRLATLP